jgi:Uma2 family endonuclease
MPPTGFTTGARNAEINRQFGNWTKRDGRGAASDSSTGFKLPNGAERSPDAG